MLFSPLIYLLASERDTIRGVPIHDLRYVYMYYIYTYGSETFATSMRTFKIMNYCRETE